MKFSIITPSYNQLQWLRLCIRSVRDQIEVSHEATDKHPVVYVEHIVQDAGTPGIETLAREFGAEFHSSGKLVFDAIPPRKQGSSSCQESVDPNVSLKIFSEPDSGMYDAVNRGLARACGDVIAYLNCDEQYLPGALSTVASFFRDHQSIEMLFGDVVVIDTKGEYLCSRLVTLPGKWHTSVHTLSIFTAATFFRSRLISDKSIYFRPEWKIIGDALWILDHLEAGTRMGLMRKSLSVVTETGENLVLSERTAVESQRLKTQAHTLAKMLLWFLKTHHRLKRLIRGAYTPPAEPYQIYTHVAPCKRREFKVTRPTYRLQGRYG